MQTLEQTHLELIKSLLSAFSRGDIEAVRNLLSEDVRLHFPGNNALSGEYRGRDRALEALARSMQWTGGTTRVQMHDVLANETHGVLLYNVRARRGDRSIEYRYIDLYHFREGQICEIYGYPAEDPAAFDAFYSE